MDVLIILLVLFQLKHWLCDYTLQLPWMVGRKANPSWRKWVPALAAHAGIHAGFTFAISAGFMFYVVKGIVEIVIGHPLAYGTALEGFLRSEAWILAIGLAIFDFLMHFAIDRLKAAPWSAGRWHGMSKDDWALMGSHLKSGINQEYWKTRRRHHKFFWWTLGFDQMSHHLTHYAIIWALMKFFIGAMQVLG